jgi:hypothetical protein
MKDFTEHEKNKIKKMVDNGTTKEGAEKTRLALRHKKRVEQVIERKRDAIH